MTARLNFIVAPAHGLSYILVPINAKKGFFFNNDKLDFISEAQRLAHKTHPEIKNEIVEELIAYFHEMSSLSENSLVFRMSSIQYWIIAGKHKYPHLGNFAEPFTLMIASSAIAERTWSTFSFVHSKLRNRLTNDRVQKLVFLYTNCTQLDHKDLNDYMMEDGAVLAGNECEQI